VGGGLITEAFYDVITVIIETTSKVGSLLFTVRWTTDHGLPHDFRHLDLKFPDLDWNNPRNEHVYNGKNIIT